MSETVPVQIESMPLNVPSRDFYNVDDLAKERRFFIDDDIDYSSISFVREIMKCNIEDAGIPIDKRKPIWLYIMSYGGDIDYMYSIIDAINASVTPVNTVNLGVAASAASLIFISGKERFMMPSAKVIIHEGSAQLAGDAIKVQDAADSYKNVLKKTKEYILDHTQIPKTLLMKRRNNDWNISADECLEYKICTKIVNSMEEVI